MKVLNVFKTQKLKSVILGCVVTKGKIRRNHLIKIIRNKKILYNGRISSLKRFKDDVEEVKIGMECGICVQSSKDVLAGDMIETLEQ